jgi:hypothetical protein
VRRVSSPCRHREEEGRVGGTAPPRPHTHNKNALLLLFFLDPITTLRGQAPRHLTRAPQLAPKRQSASSTRARRERKGERGPTRLDTSSPLLLSPSLNETRRPPASGPAGGPRRRPQPPGACCFGGVEREAGAPLATPQTDAPPSSSSPPLFGPHFVPRTRRAASRPPNPPKLTTPLPPEPPQHLSNQKNSSGPPS